MTADWFRIPSSLVRCMVLGLWRLCRGLCWGLVSCRLRTFCGAFLMISVSLWISRTWEALDPFQGNITQASRHLIPKIFLDVPWELDRNLRAILV